MTLQNFLQKSNIAFIILQEILLLILQKIVNLQNFLQNKERDVW